MKKGCFFSMILVFIIGGLVGAGVTYQYVKCKVEQTNIHFGSDTKEGPGLTITKTGNE